MLLQAAYLFDEKVREEAHRNKRNYWWAYIAEILDRLGLTAVKVSPAELSKELSTLSLLFLGNTEGTPFTQELDAWVRAGGILIGSNVQGLDQIFGNQFIGCLGQEKGEFSLSGRFLLKRTDFTQGIDSPLHPGKPLLAASPLRLVKAATSMEIASGRGGSFITARQYGKGWAFYFSFDLAQTFWVIGQGRPVDQDYDGDGYWRTSDASIIEDNEPEIAYADELLFLLQNMVSRQPHPLIHQIPPQGGKIPDFVFYYPGDDEGTPGVQVPASKFMRSRSLPYHINLMLKNGKFAVTPEEVVELRENGTELSLHFNFMDGFTHPGGYEKADIKEQTELYLQRFGELPICANTHWFRWTGWAEPALWMREAGIRADNSFTPKKSPPLNPVNSIGFLFGTAFPFFFWSDYKSGNERIDFLELPVVAYECGYQDDKTDFSKLKKIILLARHYQLVMCLFYHPVYITKRSACRAAIDKLLSLLKEEGLEPLHLGANEVADWWFARSRIRIEKVNFDGAKLTFFTSCHYPAGFIAKIPLGSLTPLKVDFPHKIMEKFGQRWLFLALPGGEKEVTVELAR